MKRNPIQTVARHHSMLYFMSLMACIGGLAHLSTELPQDSITSTLAFVAAIGLLVFGAISQKRANETECATCGETIQHYAPHCRYCGSENDAE